MLLREKRKRNSHLSLGCMLGYLYVVHSLESLNQCTKQKFKYTSF